ncbi:hypothetical protein [Bradyrhizobium cenepequi]|uniref:hypothetical protein n=1 Tax=Bradyrhizobium cenepequi TaxID=2821403 RepID=UPI001CE244A8|nr:hypothetical protein [Bradyrhizobium cenepequi]MCA6111612.1 hypothetical protein [Bradyrhizobium cenepequi]
MDVFPLGWEGGACSTPALKIGFDRVVEFGHRVPGRLQVSRIRSSSPGENRCDSGSLFNVEGRCLFAADAIVKQLSKESACGRCCDYPGFFIDQTPWLISAGTLPSLEQFGRRVRSATPSRISDTASCRKKLPRTCMDSFNDNEV